MPTPNEMARKAPWRREHDAWRAEIAREERLDEIAREGGHVTQSKAYRKAAAKAGLRLA